MKVTNTQIATKKSYANLIWLVLSAAMAALITTLLFLPQTLGAGITSIFSLMLWYGIFGYALFRFLQRPALFGFIGGSIIGMVIYIGYPLVL